MECAGPAGSVSLNPSGADCRCKAGLCKQGSQRHRALSGTGLSAAQGFQHSPVAPMLLPTLARLAMSRKCCGASGVRNSRLDKRKEGGADVGICVPAAFHSTKAAPPGMLHTSFHQQFEPRQPNLTHPPRPPEADGVDDAGGVAEALQVGVKALPKPGGHSQAAQPAQPILEHPVDGGRRRQRALGAHAHCLQQRLRDGVGAKDSRNVAQVGVATICNLRRRGPGASEHSNAATQERTL